MPVMGLMSDFAGYKHALFFCPTPSEILIPIY